MKTKLPMLMIIVGLVILGVGIWQMADVKMKTNASLKKAQQIVAQQQNTKNTSNTPNTPNVQKQTSKKGQSLKVGATIGLLTIGKIKAELPIVEGTDPDDLARGVGHYKGSYLPGDKGQIVLSGHRDTVFSRLGELKIGDTLMMQMPTGNYPFEITHTKIVKADDTSIITLQHTKEELVLTTCYPFRYIGNAPKRYIIYAKPKSS